MITFNNNRIEYGENYITSKRIDGFIILYETPTKGKLTSHLVGIATSIDGDGNVSTIQQDTVRDATKSFNDVFFKGKNILDELHNIYINELTKYNSGIKFTKSL